MSLGRICARCQAPLPDDAAEDALCATCDMEVQGTMVAPDDLALPEPISPPAPAFTLPPAQPEFTIIGDFEIISKLGQGGMGAVYRARQISLDRVVALKVLPQQFEEDEDYVARFQREAAVAARLSHPNLVRVFTSGQADGCHFIAMELIEGENLRQRMKREPVTRSDALRICADVARALQCGWDTARLIHRDIKPANIYLSRSGEVKLGDLGLAKSALANTTGITQTGTSLGTPLYMSPEQGKGEKNIDFRADIYSLGCTLYELLTGRPPYEGRDGHTLIHQHIHSPLPPIAKALPGAPMPLVRLVGKMLKKTPRERHTDYADLIAEMDWVREQIDFPAASATNVPLMASRRDTGRTAAPATSPGTAPVAAALRAAPPPADAPPRGSQSRGYKLPLALAAAVLVLGALAFVVMKPKPSPVRVATLPKATPALIASQTNPEPGKAAAASAGVASWQDLRRVPDFASLPGVEIGGDGVTFTQQGIYTHTAKFRNGAIRVRGTFSEEWRKLKLVARYTHGTAYQMEFGGGGVKLSRRIDNDNPDLPGTRSTSMQFAPGDPLEMELRVVGTRIIGRLNGKTVLEADNATATEGTFGVGFGLREQKITVRSVEFLPLDGLPEAGALKLAGVATPGVEAAPAGALTFAGHRYQFFRGAISWAEAKAKAEAMGGHLATITSKEEDEWIKKTFGAQFGNPSNIHLGGRREFREGGTWEWVTGEPFIYTGWRPGAPPTVTGNFTLQYWNSGGIIGWAGLQQHDSSPRDFLVEWDDAGSAASAYPQLATWVNDTASIREQALKDAGMKADGEWLEATRTTYLNVARGALPSDFAVRVRFVNRVEVHVRNSSGGHYSMTFTGSLPLIAKQAGSTRTNLAGIDKLPNGFNARSEHELVATAVGDRLGLWLDGQLLLSASDSSFTGAAAQVVAFPGDNYSKPARIKSVEWGELAASAAASPGSQTPATATKDAPFMNSLGMRFVPVPITGGPTDGKRVLFSVWETRVQDYEAFAKETQRDWPKPNFAQGPTHPAVNVHWNDTTAFCAWLTERERKAGRLAPGEEYRLPSDHEWSCAVGIGTREDPALTPGEKNDRIPDVFPWEGAWPPPPRAGNYAGSELRTVTATDDKSLPASYRDDFPQTAPVGSFPANVVGLYDLGGNVSEWTTDWHDSKHERKTLRGESWNGSNWYVLLSSHRNSDTLTPRSNRYGFRVVLAPVP